MKKVGVLLIVLLICIIITAVIIWRIAKINTNFATSITIRYYYADENIEHVISDADDIDKLKAIFNGFAWQDSPACGFSLDVSVTFEGNNEKLILCPAYDGDPIIRIGETGRYMGISDDARKMMNNILEKYGMVFTCV